MEQKKIEAFTVSARVHGKTWMNRATTLTAHDEEAARIKGIKVLRLTEEHEITVEPVTVYNSGAKLSAENYPYGRLKCTAYFSVESTKNGFRSIFQTINPKTGKLNAPKKSTYTAGKLPTTHAGGKIGFCGYLSFNGSEEINKGLQFMADFHELFTAEEVKNIAVTALMMSKVNAKAYVVYTGASWEDLKPLVEQSVKILVEICNTGSNLWASALLDVAAIEGTKIEGYQPFKVVSTLSIR